MKLKRDFDMRDAADRAYIIRMELRDRGLTVADFATQLKVTKTTVHDVINSRRTSDRIRQFIALQINHPVEMLWPPTIT